MTKIVLTYQLDGEEVAVLAKADVKTSNDVLKLVNDWKTNNASSFPVKLKLEPYYRIIKKDDTTFLIDFGDYAYFIRVEKSPNLMP